MSADLVCKLVVWTLDGKRHRGSGYPITPNRIITAAHVVADAAPSENPETDSDVRQIELFFGAHTERLDAPVYIEWNGADVGVDAAVLRCQLPPEYQPTHRLQTASVDKPTTEWVAQGYTDIGQETRADGIDVYRGWLARLRIDTPTVTLNAENGPMATEEWAGGSGSMVFDAETGQTALAVVTDYQGGKKLDQLVAVPILLAPIGKDEGRVLQRYSVQVVSAAGGPPRPCYSRYHVKVRRLGPRPSPLGC